MSTKVGFIGLGIMGAPMAKNLISAGFDVTVYNRSQAKVDELVAQGAAGATSIAGAVENAEFVVTMLPDSPDVQAVVGGKDGVLAHLRQGAMLIDASTISPEVARSIAESGALLGHGVLDAPVSGGQAGAIEGSLSIMVGGDAEHFTRALPILEAVGKTIVHVGPSGSGQIVKAANQIIVAGTIELVSEALVLLDAYGVDLHRAVEVLSGGLAGNAIFSRKVPNMLDRNFAPGFRIDLHHKDLSIALDSVRAAGVSAPLAITVAGLVASLRAQGLGSLDHSALLLQVEELSGRGTISEYSNDA